ncbi:unnamed protein product, partial [Tenebrio molitor]
MEKPSQLCFVCISKRKTDEMWSCGVAAGIGVMLGKNKTGLILIVVKFIVIIAVPTDAMRKVTEMNKIISNRIPKDKEQKTLKKLKGFSLEMFHNNINIS